MVVDLVVNVNCVIVVHQSVAVVSRIRIPVYQPKANCLVLFKHVIAWAFCLALDNTGSSIAARMAMMAMTSLTGAC